MNFFLQNKPFVVPTTDGKRIEEHFGRVSTKMDDISIAHMVAPAGWSEPAQNPEFDEWTLVNKGQKCVEVDGNAFVLTAGQSILVKKGAKVRYSNPFQEPCEYWSICLPAFSVEAVHRGE
jgi:mannose-6-phosphate isomerase-like protein (cupin superfamily)